MAQSKTKHQGCLAYRPCPKCEACNCGYRESVLCVCHYCFAYIRKQPDGTFTLISNAEFAVLPLQDQADLQTIYRFVFARSKGLV